jgi:RimJ/RimL family protein N-acetyltransferase
MASDIERIYKIFRGNPEFLMLRDDIATDGDYDLSTVTRYCESAMLDSARYLLVIVDKATDSAVGLVDFVEASSADGRPWIGLVVIHHSAQRQGLGSEALEAVIAALGSAGHPTAHMAVMEANAQCRAFAESVGFAAYDTATVATSQGTQQVVLMERPLRRTEPTVRGT